VPTYSGKSKPLEFVWGDPEGVRVEKKLHGKGLSGLERGVATRRLEKRKIKTRSYALNFKRPDGSVPNGETQPKTPIPRGDCQIS